MDGPNEKKILIISSFSKKENIYKIGKEKAYYKTTMVNKKESSAKLVVQISFVSSGKIYIEL